MTSRSSITVVALGLVLCAARAEGQDTLQVAPPSGEQRTHIVAQGETLWGLADRYFGDPMLWPAIYRLNTMVVEDPHWIFPGEELQLGQGDLGMSDTLAAAEARSDTLGISDPLAQADTVVRTDTVTVAGDQPAGGDTMAIDRPTLSGDDLPPASAGAPTVFQRSGSRRNIMSGRTTALTYRAISPSTFYGVGFLTEGDRLPWAEVVGSTGKVTLGSLNSVTSARIFESVEIRAPEGASYHIGDSLLVAQRSREVQGWGEIIEPTAIARVREVSGRRVVAEVLSQWSRVSSEQVAMPVEPFRNPGGSPPVPIENGMTGSIIEPRELQAIAGARQVVFIDRGRNDGVSVGDIFEVLRPNPPEASPETPLQQVALIQIAHLRQRSAAGVLIQIADLGVSRGSPVRLIRKMPS